MLALENLKLLVVDDHEDCRMLLTVVLEAEGAQVTALDCAIATFSALQQSPFDILISDIVMPNIDGYSLIKKVRACEAMQVNSILAIAITAMAGAESYQKAIFAGFHHCLYKPIELEQLTTTIRALCEQSS
jgi:CheY-like chemotaxis protein